ncbi:MAG: choice-of-anchor C family protein [Thermoleophilia bacterium]
MNVHMRIDGAAANDSIIGPRDVGDVNGDGLHDILVRANTASPAGRSNAGSAWIVFGSATAKTVDLASLGTNGYQIMGASSGDNFGQTGLSMGDVNGDGLADVAIGARNASNNGRASSGSVYVIFGKSTTTTIDTASLGSNGYRIDGAASNTYFGSRIGTGDVNGDGKVDVLAGASGEDNNGRNNSGSVYVVFGKSDTTTIDAASLGTKGRRIDGAVAGDQIGVSLPGGADINNDGYADIVMSSPYADRNGRTDSGSTWVVFGGTSTTTLDLASITSGQGFRIDGATAGDGLGNIGPIGDIDDDGFEDIAITASSAGYNGRSSSGSLFIVRGGTSTADVDLAGTYNGFRIDGAAASDGLSFGWAAGDIDGDGYPDILLGASGADNNGRTNSGSSYVVFGGSLGSNIDLATAGTNVIRIDGAAAGDALGTSLSTIADLGGDGYPELMLTAQGADNNGRNNSGSFYVVGFTEALPTAITGGVTSVSGTGATLQGTVNPNGRGASYVFQYGTSPLLGTTTASVSAGSGTADVAASTAVTGLQANTTYYYRARVTDVDGYIRYGQILSFTTDTTAPTTPTVAGGSLSWLSQASTTVTASGSTDAPSGLVGQYFNNTTLTGAPALARSENIDFDWGTGSPGVGVNSDNFGSRWTGVLVVPTTGEYRFRTNSDDGVRMWVDGHRVINNWTSHSVTTDTSTYLNLTAGTRVGITVEHYELTGSAVMQLLWETPTTTGTFATMPASVFEPVSAGLDHYEYRTSTDGGTTWSAAATGPSRTITAENQTLVQFRSVDAYGNASAWTPAASDATNTVRLDRTAPTAPTVSGGSLSWQSVASVTVSATGSTDTGGSALSGYQYRTSTDGGATWGSATSGSSLTVSAEGETLVQFRSVDGAGNTSAWTPASSGATNTIRIDRTAPTNATASGGSLSWQSVASVTVTGSGSSGGNSGIAGYEYRTSTDGGTTWSAGTSGSSVTVSEQGETLVQFRTTDGAGNVGSWSPSSAVAGSTVRLDRTAPGGNPGGEAVSNGGFESPVIPTNPGYADYTAGQSIGSWTVSSASVSLHNTTLQQVAAGTQALDVNGSGPGVVTQTLATTPGTVYRITFQVAGNTYGSPSLKELQVGWGGSALRTIRFDTTGRSTSAMGWTTVTLEATATSTSTALTFTGLSSGQYGAMVDAVSAIPQSGISVSGGSLSWQSVASVTVSASGATDALSGVSGYQYRTSTDGGTTWGSATSGSSVTISAEGETLVQFRSVDGAGNTGAWTPSASGASNTVRIDRTAPSAPTVSGGSLSWLSAGSGTVTASGSTDTGGSALSGYQYRTSTDNGTTWSSATAGGSVTVTAEGQTLVQYRSVDGAGNTSAWTPASSTAGSTVRLDRTAPTAPTVSGGSLSWQSVASVAVSASGSTDTGGSALSGYQYRTSTDNGATWGSATSGSSVSVTAEGETLVQYRSVDGAGNTSAWTPASSGASNTVRIDRTAPTAPTVSGGSLSWQTAASVTVSGTGSTDAGGSALSGYQYRTSTDGGTTWGSATAGGSVTVSAEGETLVQIRSVDTAGNTSAWTPASAGAANTVRLDRTSPTAPTVSGGSLSWQSVASVTVSASGSSGGPSGLTGYEYRTSTDAGTTWSAGASGSSVAVTAEGETLVQFRSVDGAGNTSSWTPSSAGAGNTVRIDRTAATAPTVSGGSLSWQSVASVTVSASGSSGGAGGLSGYEYRTSTDAGTTWSAATSGASVAVTAEGETLIQFRAVDNAGNASAWTPAHVGGASANGTVRIDRTAPTAPTVSGGSLTWSAAASATISATGGTDSGGSALSGAQYRTSTDGGTTWSATPVTASSLAVTAEGETLVQFRNVDNAGNASAWTPASSGASNTVRLDRSGPTTPTASGGSLSWQSVASVTVTGSGATDAYTSVASYQYRTSTDGGTTWSAGAAGSGVTVSAEGETLVQFRALDTLGNAGSWGPAAGTAGGTVRINRSGPTAPTVSGGSLSWQNTASVTITGSGATVGGGTITGYQYRTSTDGGSTWGSATAGNSVAISAEGETVVQFRAIDDAGNSGPWGPSSPAAGSTARIDRTNPTAPTVSGGSASWQSVASITLSATGATDAVSGVASHEYRTSTDGGTTWTAAAAGSMVIVSAEGDTRAQFRSVDAAGNSSAWSTAAIARIDRTAPTDPTVSGGSLSWQSVASVTVSGTGSTDSGGSALSGYESRTSTDGGTTWSAAASGSSVTVTAEGETLVQLRAVDNAGNAGAWTPAHAGGASAAGTARIDRTAPTAPTVSGGSLSWQNTASVTVSASGSAGGPSGLTGYEYRTSTDGGTTWSAAAAGASLAVTAEGETLVQFRSADGAGNTSAWTPASAGASNTVRIDRTAPGAPTVSGGSLSWQDVPSVTITAGSATDAGSGVASYERRTSTDGGTTWSAASTGTSVTVIAEGETLVQFRAVDNAGIAGTWTPAHAGGASAAGTARIDRTAPTAPSVSGGSLTWQNTASVTVSASGSTDAGGSTLTGYEYRTSTDGGTTWTAAAAGSSVTVTAQGETLVQFRSTDGAGHTSAWTPASAGASNTVRIDRTAPAAPTASGGSVSWQSVASITLSATGATDAHAGVASHEYRTSTDGGTTWTAPAAGAMVITSSEGELLAQFRAIDAAGNASAWSATGIARIDRTDPTAPTASGGSASWQSTPSVAVSASGGADGVSGIAGVAYRTSTDGGTTWSATGSGSPVLVTAQGETLVQFANVDAAGNTSAWSASQTVRIDRTDPTLPTVTGGDPAWRNAASAAISAGGSTDAGGAALSGYEYRTSTDGGTTWSAPAAGPGVVVSAEGETLAQFRSVDGAGNTSAWTASAIARLDRTDPAAPTVSGGSLSWQNTASVTITASGATDAGGSALTGYEYRTSTDGGTAWSAPATGTSVTVSAEGETLAQFRSVDGAGNASAWTPAHVGGPTAAGTARIDRAAPAAPTGVSAPAATATDPVVTWNAVGDASSYIVTRNGVQVGTTAGTTFTDTTTPGEGVYAYRVIAVDQAGNQSTPGGPVSVVLDVTGPADPTFGAGSDGSLAWRNVASVTIGVDTEAGTTAEHRTSTDGGATWSAAAAGDTVVVTAEGETLVQFRAVDAAGNTSGWVPAHAGGPTAAGTARIDRTDPAAPANLTGPAATNGDPSLTWDPVSGATSYIVTRDGVQIGTVPSGTAFTDTAAPGDGTYQYRVIAVDRAGNQSVPAGPLSVTVDTVAPAAPAPAAGSEGSLAWRDVASVTIAVDPTPGTTTQYRTSTDGGTTWTTPATGTTVVITDEGETLVQFRTVDPAGNTSAWTPSVAGGPVADGTARIDRTDPAVPGNVTGPAATNDDPVITWDPAAGADSYIVTRDGVQVGTVSSGTTFTDTTVPGDGTYAYRVIAVDHAGNQSAPGGPATVVVDTVAPAAPSPAAGSEGSLAWRDVPSVTIAVDPTPGTATEYRTSTDGGSTWTAPATGTTVTITAEGETLVQFRTVDPAGNTSAWTPSVAGGPVADGTARIDRTDPAVPGNVTGPAATNTDPLITWDPATGATSYIVTRDGVQVGTVTTGTTFTDTTLTGDGTYVYRVIAVDHAGNQSAPSGPATVALDTVAPTAPAPAAGSEGSLAWRDVPSVTIAVDPTPGTTTQYRTSTDGGTTWTAPATGTTVTITDEGETLVQFRTVDPAGNTSAWTPRSPAAPSPTAPPASTAPRPPPRPRATSRAGPWTGPTRRP